MHKLAGKTPKEIADIWATALESGDYKQGKGWLKQQQDGSYSYCCLGVLCELAGLECKETTTNCQYSYGDITAIDDYLCKSDSFLPINFSDELKMKHLGAFLSKENEYHRLTTLNDDGFSFTEIAAVIRENYKSIFNIK